MASVENKQVYKPIKSTCGVKQAAGALYIKTTKMIEFSANRRWLFSICTKKEKTRQISSYTHMTPKARKTRTNKRYDTAIRKKEYVSKDLPQHSY